MMETFIDVLIILLVLTNFRLLGSSRISACIQTTALQAIILSAFPIALHTDALGFHLILLSGATIVVKAIVLPWLLRKTLRDINISREVEPLMGYTASIIIGAALLGLCLLISEPLQSTHILGGRMLIPGALFTILSGLFLIISRRKALTQVIGYLVLENGIYAFGAALAVEEPLVVEMGVLLDVFVAVFVMGITIHHISRDFDHIDTDRLSLLKD